jgi:hypothetical protein
MVDGQLIKHDDFMKKLIIFFLAVTVTITGCKDDEYDGLFNIDPYPENAVTFPDAKVDGYIIMDENAFIVQQNSIAAGQVQVRIAGPANKQIVSVETKAQRFRAPVTWPNLSPTAPTGGNLRAPGAAFSRTVASNLGVTTFSPASEVTYTVSLTSLPASLTNATLGPVAAPAGATPNYDVFRFYFLVTYSDGSTVVSNEVRVVVTG